MHLGYLNQIKKMSEIRSFNTYKELGSYIKKVRRANNEKLNMIAVHLIIKKQILSNIEEGNISEEEYASNNHLKGFLNSYMRYLKIDKQVRIIDKLKQKPSSVKKSNLSLETAKQKKNIYGSMLILFSLVLICLIYLIWNKQTYYQLYKLGQSLG